MSAFDVVVIGSGPGGYVAAIRSSQLGFKTAIIEKYPTLGGTCLNVGCIPSKALLDSSHHYHDAHETFKEHGSDIEGEIKVNFEQMIARKQGVVDQNVSGIKYLMDKNKITVFAGVGSFEDATHIKVTKTDGSGEEIIEAKNTIIATGSKPSTLPFIKIDKERVITSTEALKLKEVPKHLIVIGGGVIGLELGQVYLRLGAQVSVVEYLDRIIPGMDAGLSKELTKVLKKQGMKFYTSHKVKSVENKGSGVQVQADNAKGETITLDGDYALVSVGRRPFTDGLNAEKAGVKITERGQIEVNDHLQTSVPNIYAIGDVIKGAMLAHKAEEEGVFVAETIAGQKQHSDKSGSFPFKALGRSRASMDTDGFVKILADATTDEVLGIHMIGARTADLIAEAVIAMEFKASAEDIARSSHAHPTYAEAVKEAALAATENRAIHI